MHLVSAVAAVTCS